MRYLIKPGLAQITPFRLKQRKVIVIRLERVFQGFPTTLRD